MRQLCALFIVATAIGLTAGGLAPALADSPKVPGDAPQGTNLNIEDISLSVERSLDRTVDPCVDFYRFACGGWLDSVKLPADETQWGRSFSVIHERNRELLQGLIEGAAKDPGTDPDRRKVGDFYASCMDEAAVEKAGLAAVQPWFLKIDAAKDRDSLFALAGEIQAIGAGPFLAIETFADLKDPGTMVAHFEQGGLGLPERAFYLSPDAQKKELRAAYVKHVGRMLEFSGLEAAEANRQAAAILKFETGLATASRTIEKMRDVAELHHRLNAAGLEKLAPKLPWQRFFAGIGRPDLEAINVQTPEFFPALQKEIARTPVPTLQAYLRFEVLSATAGLLTKEVYAESFDFFGRKLSGQQEPQPRWKRCIAATEQAMGDAIGKLYIQERFAGNSKELATAMIGQIADAFAASLPSLAWMDEPTRQAALVKRGTLAWKIGYPDPARDFTRLAIVRGNHFSNAIASRQFETARQLAEVGKPVDRREWGMNAQTVNASYNPLENAFTYPAGILQPPFFHKDYPLAMNLGGMGFVMGHELTHGFDDQGSKFDSKGVLTDWWTPVSVKGFEERTSCIDKQYSAYEVAPGVHVSGKLTLGENIADNGGLKQAWNVLQSRQKERGEGPTVAGFTEDQLFFVAAAQTWCTQATPESDRLQVETDPHSPSKFRVMGPMINHPGFAGAFSCKPGTPMNPPNKCEVW
ncbi:MAG: M13 family metallopeptidase [Thermoanaerobaculia bacterium]